MGLGDDERVPTTCHFAVEKGRVEVLRWARANGCPWFASDQYEAEWELGYTDDLGNLVDDRGNLIYDSSGDDDDEY